MDHESELIRAFFLSAKRERSLDLLASAKGRQKFLATLYHSRDLDPRYRVDIAPADQLPDTIFELLTARGAPARCHLMSSDRKLDGRDLALSDALAQIVGFGEGTLVSCIPGRLGYFEGEEPGDRVILERSVG